MIDKVMEKIKEAKIQSSENFEHFYIKNVAQYKQLLMDAEEDHIDWYNELRHYLNPEHWSDPCFRSSNPRRFYNIMDVFKDMEYAKSSIAKYSFETYYLTEVMPLQEKTFMSQKETRSIINECLAHRKRIEDENRAEEVKWETIKRNNDLKAAKKAEKERLIQEQRTPV